MNTPYRTIEGAVLELGLVVGLADQDPGVGQESTKAGANAMREHLAGCSIGIESDRQHGTAYRCVGARQKLYPASVQRLSLRLAIGLMRRLSPTLARKSSSPPLPAEGRCPAVMRSAVVAGHAGQAASPAHWLRSKASSTGVHSAHTSKPFNSGKRPCSQSSSTAAQCYDRLNPGSK
jgi:hypothetical protein